MCAYSLVCIAATLRFSVDLPSISIPYLVKKTLKIENVILDIGQLKPLQPSMLNALSGLRWLWCPNYWNIHINEMLRKAASRMYAVRLLLPLLGKDKTLLVYDSIVSSILSYAVPLPIGMNASTLYKVERLQKRHHKLICGEGCQCTLFQSILKSSAVKLFLQAASNTDHPLHDRIPPRLSTGRFRQPLAKTTRILRSFVPFTSTLVNSDFKRCWSTACKPNFKICLFAVSYTHLTLPTILLV